MGIKDTLLAAYREREKEIAGRAAKDNADLEAAVSRAFFKTFAVEPDSVHGVSAFTEDVELAYDFDEERGRLYWAVAGNCPRCRARCTSVFFGVSSESFPALLGEQLINFRPDSDHVCLGDKKKPKKGNTPEAQMLAALAVYIRQIVQDETQRGDA